MLGQAGLDLERPAPASREQQALAFHRAKQKPTLGRRKPKSGVGRVDDFLRLLK